MALFPFFKEIEGAKGLIVGGGKVALRKAEKMLLYGPRLTIIAPEILPEFYNMDITIIKRSFHSSDITKDLEFVIAASDNGEQNKQIYLLCQEKNIPVNVVDQPKYCTFMFPALIKRGNLSVGISTSGASPSAAIWLKEEMEQILPDEMEEILEWLQKQRVIVKDQIHEEAARSHCLKELFLQCLEEKGPLNDGMRDQILNMERKDHEK